MGGCRRGGRSSDVAIFSMFNKIIRYADEQDDHRCIIERYAPDPAESAEGIGAADPAQLFIQAPFQFVP